MDRSSTDRSESRSVHPRLQAIYHIRCDARSIETRARAIAVEQSVEMPLAAIDDDFVRSEIVGRVEAIAELENGLFEVRIALAAATVGHDAGQLLNMLFGNIVAARGRRAARRRAAGELVRAFGGPRHGLHGLRRRVGAPARALTCSALKPQGLPAGRARGPRPRASRKAASTTSRTITASPTRPIRRSRQRVEAIAAALRASSATARALCAEPVGRSRRACAGRSPPPRLPASIP